MLPAFSIILVLELIRITNTIRFFRDYHHMLCNCLETAKYFKTHLPVLSHVLF